MTPTRLAAAVLLVAAPFAAAAQQAGKIWRLGFVGPPPSSSWGADLVQAFQQGREERGYRDGQNTSIEYRSTEDATPERLALHAAELVRLRVHAGRCTQK